LSFYRELKIRLHNYFPIPKNQFVLNLASPSKETIKRSKQLIKQAVNISADLGSTDYAIHAGFCVEMRTSEFGRLAGLHPAGVREDSWDRYLKNFCNLREYSDKKGVNLSVENNVVSTQNFKIMGKENPFLLTDWCDVERYLIPNNIPLLCDVAHLKVSCKTLKLDFFSQLDKFVEYSNYFHVSDNNGLEDLNWPLKVNGAIHTRLSKAPELKKKIQKNNTIEVYTGLSDVHKTIYHLYS